MKKPYRNGFTLIELMIVVGILGILLAVAIPKYGELLNKANEGETKGNLGMLRSAISIYYTDNDGKFPVGAAGTNVTFLQDALTAQGKYLTDWPSAYVPIYHQKTKIVNATDSSDPLSGGLSDTGEWAYVGNSASNFWGRIMLQCGHKDLKGTIWSEN